MTESKRPGFITLLTVLGVVQGLVALLLGVFVVADRNDSELLAKINDSDVAEGHQITPNLLLAIGIVAIVLGVLVIVASFALSKGSAVARWVVVLSSLGIAASGLHSLVALHGEQQLSGAFSLVFALFTIWYLFANEDAERFFHDV